MHTNTGVTSRLNTPFRHKKKEGLHTQAGIHTYIHTYTHTHTHTHTNIYIYIYIHTHTYILTVVHAIQRDGRDL
jgi:hypothetical protein